MMPYKELACEKLEISSKLKTAKETAIMYL